MYMPCKSPSWTDWLELCLLHTNNKNIVCADSLARKRHAHIKRDEQGCREGIHKYALTCEARTCVHWSNTCKPENTISFCRTHQRSSLADFISFQLISSLRDSSWYLVLSCFPVQSAFKQQNTQKLDCNTAYRFLTSESPMLAASANNFFSAAVLFSSMTYRYLRHLFGKESLKKSTNK